MDSEGRIGIEKEGPSEYLERLALSNQVLGTGEKLVGVMPNPSTAPSIVISQPFIEGSEPTQREVQDSLYQDGFRRVPGGYLSYYRPSDGIILTDTKIQNFVKTVDGEVVPIDVMIAQEDPAKFRALGWDMQPGTAEESAKTAAFRDPKAEEMRAIRQLPGGNIRDAMRRIAYGIPEDQIAQDLGLCREDVAAIRKEGNRLMGRPPESDEGGGSSRPPTEPPAGPAGAGAPRVPTLTSAEQGRDIDQFGEDGYDKSNEHPDQSPAPAAPGKPRDDEGAAAPDWSQQGTPRDATDALEATAAHLGAGDSPGDRSPASRRSDELARQSNLLRDLAERQGAMIPPDRFREITNLSRGTQENDVYHVGNRAFKVTKYGIFGYTPELPDRGGGFGLNRQPGTPAEYFRRLAIANRIFGDHYKIEGVQMDGRGHAHAVTSQPWKETPLDSRGDAPVIQPDEIRDAMTRLGFREVPGDRLNPNSWYRPADGVIAEDLHPGNWIKARNGQLVPIDAMLNQVDPHEFARRGWDMSDPRGGESGGESARPSLDWD